jgi:CO/xanthine dehydrogenase Mo-binding subunit
LYQLIGKVVAQGHYIAPKTVPLQEDANNPNNLIDDYNLHFAYDFGTQAAVVSVDKITNEIEVLKVFAAHDVGKIINELGIKGQIEGGIVMGLGYALSEEFIINEKGVITNSFKKIGVPLIKDAPEIEYQLIENPTKYGPYGAKGIGEITMVPTTPAIINAIYDATGIRITNLPAKSNKLKK